VPADHSQYDHALAALAPPGVNGFDPDNTRFACPVCGSSDSISLRQGEGGLALIKCHSGDCGFGPIIDALGIEHGTKVTLDTLADYLGLDREDLEDEGWHDAPYTTSDHKTVERVAIPYTKPDGQELALRYRVGLTGSKKFTWQTKPRVHPRAPRAFASTAMARPARRRAPCLARHHRALHRLERHRACEGSRVGSTPRKPHG
jgi:hypothetical protein